MRRSWPILAGAALLALLWLGPLPALAGRAFSPHMILHLGVTGAAAPLLAIGLLRVLPQAVPPRSGILLAFAASAFEFVVVWGWHVPAMHEAAGRAAPVFALQQGTFLLAGLVLWLACLAGGQSRGQAIGALAMLFTAMHMAMLGVLLVLAPRLLYAPDLCRGAFGLAPLADQQFGGALMALFGALPYVGGGAWLGFRLARETCPLAGGTR